LDVISWGFLFIGVNEAFLCGVVVIFGSLDAVMSARYGRGQFHAPAA